MSFKGCSTTSWRQLRQQLVGASGNGRGAMASFHARASTISIDSGSTPAAAASGRPARLCRLCLSSSISVVPVSPTHASTRLLSASRFLHTTRAVQKSKKAKARSADPSSLLGTTEASIGGPSSASGSAIKSAGRTSSAKVPAGAQVRDEDIDAERVRLVLPVPEGAMIEDLPLRRATGRAASLEENAAAAASGQGDPESSDSPPNQRKQGGLADPIPPAAILRLMDRSKFWLSLVTTAASTASSGGDEVAWPIVKLISKKETFDRAKAAKASASSSTTISSSASDAGAIASGVGSAPPLKQKECQLTWSVSPHDLLHKVTRAQQDCAIKGNRVQINVVVRKGQGRAFHQQGAETRHAELLKRIEEIMLSGNESAVSGEVEQEDAKSSSQLQGWVVRQDGEVTWRNQTAAVINFRPVGKRRG